MGIINSVTMMTIICNIVAMMTNTIIDNRPLLWPGGSLAEEPLVNSVRSGERSVLFIPRLLAAATTIRDYRLEIRWPL